MLALPDVALCPWLVECVWAIVWVFVSDPRVETTSESAPEPAPLRDLLTKFGVESVVSQTENPDGTVAPANKITESSVKPWYPFYLMTIYFCCGGSFA